MVWPTLGSTTAKEQNNVFNCGLTGSGYVKNMLAVKKHLITDGIQGLSSSTYINVTRKHHIHWKTHCELSVTAITTAGYVEPLHLGLRKSFTPALQHVGLYPLHKFFPIYA